MELLEPQFNLIGSVPEGTRVGLANELDVMVSFKGWPKEAFTIHEGDPFHLRRGRSAPKWLDPYFDPEGRFNWIKFKAHFLDALNSSIKTVFKHELNPVRLSESIPNDKLSTCNCWRKAKESATEVCTLCENCIATVVQTKIGACIQLLWKEEKDKSPTYCSIDLVPVFNVAPTDPMELAEMVNTGMLREPRPINWFR